MDYDTSLDPFRFQADEETDDEVETPAEEGEEEWAVPDEGDLEVTPDGEE